MGKLDGKFTSGKLQLQSAAVSGGDTQGGGTRKDGSGNARVTTAAVNGSTDFFNNGFRYSASGQLYVDGVTAVNAGTDKFSNGLRFTSQGVLLVNTGTPPNAGDKNSNGYIVDSNGKVYATIA